jgi:hypothetical protein
VRRAPVQEIHLSGIGDVFLSSLEDPDRTGEDQFDAEPRVTFRAFV